MSQTSQAAVSVVLTVNIGVLQNKPLIVPFIKDLVMGFKVGIVKIQTPT